MNNEQDGILKIYRLPNFVGKIRTYSILVDGIKVNSIKDDETIETPLLPGHHNVMVKLDWQKSNKVDINIVSGQTIRLRIGREPVKGTKAIIEKVLFIAIILLGAVTNPGVLMAGVIGLILQRRAKLRLF